MDNRRGLTLVPVVIGLVLSVILIGVVLIVSTARNAEKSRLDRLEATRLSDLGFQTVISRISSLSGMAADSFTSLPKTEEGTGYFEVKVDKKLNGDTLSILIESVGKQGTENVLQTKKFKLIRSDGSNGVEWSAIVKE